MATSGSFNFSNNTYTDAGWPNHAKVSWSAVWNSSTMLWTVSWTAVADGASNATRWVTVFDGSVTVTDGTNTLQTKSMSGQIAQAKNNTELVSGTFTVGVDSNGNRSLVFSGQFHFEHSGAAGLTSGSQTFALDQIPMASVFASQPGNVTVTSGGGTSSVSLSRYSSSYTHDVTWTFGSHSYTATGVATSTSYTIPASWLDAIPNSPTGSATIKVQTKNGSTNIGSPITAQITITASVYPTAGNISVSTSGGISGTFIAGYSKAVLSVSSAAGVNGSSIARYEFYRDSTLLATFNSSASSYSYTTATLTSAGSSTFSVKITDSRGRSVTKTSSSYTIYAYALPAFSNVSVYRSNSGGSADGSGTYCYIKATATATPAANSISSLTYATKLTTASTYGAETSLTNGTGTNPSGFANTSSYNIRITATDALGGKSYYYATIPTAEYTMDFKVGGKGVAFGKVAETDNLVESAWDIQTAGQLISGSGGVVVQSNGAYPTIQFKKTNENAVAIEAYGFEATNYNQFFIGEHHRANDVNSSYYDYYYLPQSGTDNATHGYGILTTKRFLAPTTYTTQSGAFIVTNANMANATLVIAQPAYSSAIGAQKYVFTTQPSATGFNVYVRDGSGNIPPDGTSVYVGFLAV